MTREEIKKKLESIKNMKLYLFLEIDVNQAAKMMLANNGLTEINDVSIERTTNEYTIIGLEDKTAQSGQHQVELRWLSPRNVPVGRCTCEKGQENRRCNHLIKAFHAFAILGKLGLVERMTVASQIVFKPLFFG